MIGVFFFFEKAHNSYCPLVQGYCFTALYSPAAQAINYTLVVPQGGAPLGWYAVAQGTQMVGANMAVNWVNSDSTTTTSHRGARGQVQPLESLVATSAGFSVNSEVSKSKTGSTVWSWNFPQASAPGNAVDHVFATSPTSPTESASSAVIRMHNRHDTGITLDLTKAYTGAAPAGLAGGAMPAPAMSSSGSAPRRNLSMPVVRIYLVHMVSLFLLPLVEKSVGDDWLM